jgi:hypothetical protein
LTINGGQISLTELTPALSVGALLSAGPGNYNLINYSGASNAAALAAGSQFSNLSLASSVIGANNYFVTLVHDTVNKIIQLNVDNAELERRRATWVKPEPRYRTGVLGKYARLVSSSSLGAVTDQGF